MSDDGSADLRLAAALNAYDGTPATRAELLAAVSGARLFVAITATSTAEHVAAGTGLRAESSAEMALVQLVASDGARAVPAFADAAGLTRWRLDVRPVPVRTDELCRAVLAEGAVAVLLDPLGAKVVLAERDLQALGAGFVPVPGAGVAARRDTTTLAAPAAPPDPVLIRALGQALAPERLRAARLLDGPGGPVLGVAPRDALDPAALAALASRIRDRLGEALPDSGLDLAVVPPKGPGVSVR